jgi:hypothetical protein
MRKFKIKFEIQSMSKVRKLNIEYASNKSDEQSIFEDAKEYIRANYGRCVIFSFEEINKTLVDL